MTQTFYYNDPFKLECGTVLPGYHLAYSTYGTLNEAGDNAIWIFHALTASSNAAEWWPGLVGEGKLFDPSLYFIVCVNMPGSCYGSIGPLEIKPATTQPWYHDFPVFTTRDMIRTYKPLLRSLNISRIRVGIGGSMGGQQLMEWSIEEPELFEFIVPIATNARHSPWGIAFNASQRLSIEADATWLRKDPLAGIAGMKVARSVALISYRNYTSYMLRQSEDNDEHTGNFRSESYQRYQGEKLSRRFNAFSYYRLSQSMDAHNVARGRKSLPEALGCIRAKTLVIGIESDMLFPVEEQRFIADNVPGAQFKVIDSLYGHDGFLLEYNQIAKLVGNFLQQNNRAQACQKSFLLRHFKNFDRAERLMNPIG